MFVGRGRGGGGSVVLELVRFLEPMRRQGEQPASHRCGIEADTVLYTKLGTAYLLDSLFRDGYQRRIDKVDEATCEAI